MFKKILCVALAACFTPSAYASFTANLIPPKHQISPQVKLKHVQANSDHSIDFSGRWKGECALKDDADSEVIPVDLKITQDGDRLEIDGCDGKSSYEIGAAHNHSSMRQGLYNFSFETVNWNIDKTKLVFSGRGFVVTGAAEVYTHLDKVTLSMENNALKMLIDSRYINNDMMPSFEASGACTLLRDE